MIVIAGLVSGVFVPLRVAVAKQRRAVETVRARLAASKTVRRRAEGVAVEAIQKLGASVGRVSRSSTCALADDGLYCLSEDGRWGAARPPGARYAGDRRRRARRPALSGHRRQRRRAGRPSDWLAPLLASTPRDGLLLQFEGGLSWFVAVPEAAVWFAALSSAAATT
jgi:hypothetical protein